MHPSAHFIERRISSSYPAAAAVPVSITSMVNIGVMSTLQIPDPDKELQDRPVEIGSDNLLQSDHKD